MKPSSYLVCLAVLAMSLTALGAPPPKAKTKKATADTAIQVEKLQETVAAQQAQLQQQNQQLEQLKSQLQQLIDATQQANSAAQKVQTSAEQAQAIAVQAQQSAAEAERLADQASANAVEAKTALSVVNNTAQDETKKISALTDVVGRFRFNGDVRLRGETFFQNAPGFFDRNRARIRARFGFDSKLNEDFSAGVYIATGSLGDLTSANETLTNFFNRKTIGVDKAFITYQPVAHKWLQLTGGKFAYTWTRTSLTFDPDINPEGFAEKVSWDFKKRGVKSISMGLFQLLFNELSTATDSYALGAHASARFQLGPWTATPNFVAIKWNNPSAILQASAFAVQATKAGSTTAGSFNVPGEGPGCQAGFPKTVLPSFPNCAIASNGFTNGVYTDPTTKLPRLLSGYFYTDYLLQNELKTGLKGFPFNLILEFQDNLDAAAHPLDTTGKTISSLGSQGKGYLGEVSLGQVKNKGDIQFGYGFWRQEQDAILATFSESEQRASTNILEHRIFASWKIRSNTVAMFNLWRGRTLNTGLENNAALVQGGVKTAGQVEPYLNRYQFDLVYSF